MEFENSGQNEATSFVASIKDSEKLSRSNQEAIQIDRMTMRRKSPRLEFNTDPPQQTSVLAAPKRSAFGWKGPSIKSHISSPFASNDAVVVPNIKKMTTNSIHLEVMCNLKLWMCLLQLFHTFRTNVFLLLCTHEGNHREFGRKSNITRIQ